MSETRETPTFETVARGDRLESVLAGRGLDALLVTNLVNVRYLTGYTGSNGLALVGANGLRRFVTDFRYEQQAQEQVHGYERVIGETDLLGDVLPALPEGEVQLGFDDNQVSVAGHARLRELLPERVELVPAGGAVEELRLIKDEHEVERIRAAAILADSALTAVLKDGLVGRTEREVALALEQEMRQLGAQRASFDSIVAHGAHGALPHASPRDVPIAAGTLVVIDWGAELDGYCSDCTRTYAAGEVDGQARGSTGSCSRRRWRRWRRSEPASAAERPTASRATSSPPPATASASVTASATASEPRSTRRRACRERRRRCSRPATSSPTSPASTSPACSACGSRTCSSSPSDGNDVLSTLPKELTVID